MRQLKTTAATHEPPEQFCCHACNRLCDGADLADIDPQRHQYCAACSPEPYDFEEE